MSKRLTLDVHERWGNWRALQYASEELKRVRSILRIVPAPKAKLALKRAQKSLDGALRHAEGLHGRAQREAAR